MDDEAALTYQRSNRLVIRALALIAVLVGSALLLGGPDRFNHIPSFAVAAQMPGGHLTWGLGGLTIGAWTLAASIHWSRKGVMYGMLAQTIFFSYWTITLAESAFQDQHAPLTGVAVYSGYSITCAIKYVAGHELRKAHLA